MNDSEILRQHLSVNTGWRYLEIHIAESVEKALAQWPRLREAHERLTRTRSTMLDHADR